MRNLIRLWITKTEGATAIEYGLMAAGIALAVSVAVFALGGSLDTLLYADLPAALEGP